MNYGLHFFYFECKTHPFRPVEVKTAKVVPIVECTLLNSIQPQKDLCAIVAINICGKWEFVVL